MLFSPLTVFKWQRQRPPLKLICRNPPPRTPHPPVEELFKCLPPTADGAKMNQGASSWHVPLKHTHTHTCLLRCDTRAHIQHRNIISSDTPSSCLFRCILGMEQRLRAARQYSGGQCAARGAQNNTHLCVCVVEVFVSADRPSICFLMYYSHKCCAATLRHRGAGVLVFRNVLCGKRPFKKLIGLINVSNILRKVMHD